MGDNDESNRERPSKSKIERLIELFRSLEGRENVFINKKRSGGIPEGFGWQETEEEYQKAQQEWLRQVEKEKKGSRQQ
mgnify:CR=1 FL=1